MQAPPWTISETERTESKAARVVALYLMRDRLEGIPKVKLAEILGISRWTLDRDLASVEKAINILETTLPLLEHLI